jgi:hypothetical protein
MPQVHSQSATHSIGQPRRDTVNAVPAHQFIRPSAAALRFIHAHESAQPVQAVQVGFCTCLDNVGGNAATHDAAVAYLEVYGNLAHGFGAFGYGSNVIAQELRLGGSKPRNRLVHSIDRSVSNRSSFLRLPVGIAVVPL